MMHLADEATATEEVSADEVAIIFSFLPHQDIMRARVCSTWRDAAKKTLVPLCDFRVDSVRSFNAMRVMTAALPNLQQISICSLGRGHKCSDGEDADEAWVAATANYTSHDINIISSFTKLRILHIDTKFLNGRYPALFNFPLLQRLSITNPLYLKWDLEMLASFPLLRELQVGNAFNSNALTGDLSSLRALRDTLEKVKIVGGGGLSPDIHIRGNFIDLADFPRLKELNLRDTKVTGDVRDIIEGGFPALERLCLPRTVCGGMDYEFQRISDVPSFMRAIHLLLLRTPTPTLFKGSDYGLSRAFGWRLSRDSPDWYNRQSGSQQPPFDLQIIQAGSRRGWSWCTFVGQHSCEINWLDPEPSSDYETYMGDLQRIEQHIDFFRGYHEPPTAEEYRRLCEGSGQRD